MFDVLLWIIMAVLSSALLVYLGELVTGRSCDDDTASLARIRLRAVLPVGGLLLILAKLGRSLLGVAPGSAAATGLVVLSGIAVAAIVAGLLARAWLSRREGPVEPGTGAVSHTEAPHTEAPHTKAPHTKEPRAGEPQPVR